MKTSFCFPNRKVRAVCCLTLLALFPVTTFNVLALSTTGDVVAPLGAPPPDTSSGTIMSPGVHEVLRLVQAKVAPDVIRAYIKNSATTFNLTASQIIALKDQGVPDDLLATMLERTGELNAQMRQTVQPYPNAAAQPAYPATQPTYPQAVAPYPAQPNYGPDYTTIPYTDYAYPNYYPYSGYYPYSYYSYPYFGFSSYYPYGYGYYGGNCYYYHGHWYPYWGHGGHGGHFGAHGGFHNAPGTFAHGGFGGPNHNFAFAPAHNFASRSVAPHSGFAPSHGFGGHSAGFAMSTGGFRTGGFQGGGGAHGGGGFSGGFHGGGGFRGGGGFSGGHGGGHR
jgi:hypothetical protein